MSAPSAAPRNSRGPGVHAFSTVTRTTAPTGEKKKLFGESDKLWRSRQRQTDALLGALRHVKVSYNCLPFSEA